MNIDNYLEEKRSYIDQKLDGFVHDQKVPYNKLFQAARYALIDGGKRLRPILTLATAEVFGLDNEAAASPACAIEMIHAYSLIHDDLPCMDDDDYRRGKPSLHKAFGEGHAVLTGDFLLTYAFEIIANDPLLSPEQKISLIALLAKNSGGHGMVGGQIMDIESEGIKIDIEMLRQIHQYKTGAMIAASVEFGGIIARVSPSHREILRRFGSAIGLAFQIVDDVIDVTCSQQKHGRKTSSDEINQKTTYVTLMGLDAAKEAAHELLKEACQQLSHLEHDASLLQGIAKRLVDRLL